MDLRLFTNSGKELDLNDYEHRCRECYQEWLKRKLELAYELAGIQTDERVAKALIERYTNYSYKGETE